MQDGVKHDDQRSMIFMCCANFKEVVTDSIYVIHIRCHADFDSGGTQIGEQTVERCGHDGTGRGMAGAHAQGGLDGEGGDAGGAEQALGSKDHQVSGYPGSGRRIKAGDSENSGHGPEGS